MDHTMSNPLPATSRALAIPEVVLEVISHLSQADLAQAVLVNREWRALAEPGLYAEPTLGNYFEGSVEDHFLRVEQFGGSVFGRAELAEMVKAVDLLVVDDVGPAGADQHRIQLATKLLWSCKSLNSVTLAGKQAGSG